LLHAREWECMFREGTIKIKKGMQKVEEVDLTRLSNSVDSMRILTRQVYHLLVAARLSEVKNKLTIIMKMTKIAIL
jgi:hypothetical protein